MRLVRSTWSYDFQPFGLNEGSAQERCKRDPLSQISDRVENWDLQSADATAETNSNFQVAIWCISLLVITCEQSMNLGCVSVKLDCGAVIIFYIEGNLKCEYLKG